jgi:hypothetical protein
MWALGRRTALFVVSYAPLAAMFMVLQWPSGWSSRELVLLGIWLVALSVLLVSLAATPALIGRGRRALLLAAPVVAAALVIYGAFHTWTGPMTFHPPKGHSSAAVAGIAFATCVAAALLIWAILVNARRASGPEWTVSEPRDQGAAAAGYLATYLLPLLHPEGGGWRITAAYGIYLLTVYIVFVRSDSLVVINPTLYVFGFRVFDVKRDSHDERYRKRVLLLMRGSIDESATVKVMPLGDGAYLARRVD